MRRVLLPLLLAGVCAIFPPPASAKRAKKGDDLMRVVAPAARGLVSAHPHVNVIVSFAAGESGVADPKTFRARVGRKDITSSFTPILENGRIVGMRAALDSPILRVGRRRTNRIRLMVANQIPAKQKGHVRDVDRVRFRAVEQDNQIPVARIVPESELVIPDVPGTFDGQQSFDPDSDVLTYLWDFGDGGTSTDPIPVHTYEGEPREVTVKLTVNDGQTSDDASLSLRTCPQPEGTQPGVLQVTAESNLELGAVGLGGSASKTLHIANTSDDTTTVMAVCLGSSAAPFVASPDRLELHGGESADVTVTFTPTASGHQHARIAIVATATNRSLLSVLSHGFGGTAPGTGPTLAAGPVFYTDILPIEQGLGFGVKGIMPDGTRIAPDNSVRSCDTPLNGPGTGDYCLSNADCAANGGTCPASALCLSGPNAGLPCTKQGDCPNGFCPSSAVFDPLELCGDGAGGLYLLSDEGTFTDPSPGETELAVSVMRMSLDGAGNLVQSEIIDRATTETLHIACDGFSADAGGRVFLSEFRNVPDVGSCFRSEKESLVALRKNNGNAQTILSRIDAQVGLPECEDIDPVSHLEVSPDGGKVWAGFESNGLWRIRPTPLQYIDGFTFFDELFRLHPDDGLILTSVVDGPTTSLIKVFKVTAEQVAQNPLPFTALTPCGTFQLPNNGAPGDTGQAIVVGFAAAPKAPGSTDATVLVTVAARRAARDILSQNLTIRATLAFDAPANSNTCPFAGVVNLETLDQLTF